MNSALISNQFKHKLNVRITLVSNTKYFLKFCLSAVSVTLIELLLNSLKTTEFKFVPMSHEVFAIVVCKTMIPGGQCKFHELEGGTGRGARDGVDSLALALGLARALARSLAPCAGRSLLPCSSAAASSIIWLASISALTAHPAHPAHSAHPFIIIPRLLLSPGVLHGT